MIETLVLPGQPRRFVVTNTRCVVLVTHDMRLAQKIQQALEQQPQPEICRVRV